MALVYRNFLRRVFLVRFISLATMCLFVYPVIFLAHPVLAETPVQPASKSESAKFTPDQRAEINDLIQEFIMKNPEVMLKSVTDFQKRQAQEAEEKGNAKVKELSNELYKNPASPEIGNPKGDVTIVEFFDYNCGYCKQALPAIKKLVEEDKNVRVIFKELAILGPTSDTAALWALAANKQGKYWEYHQKLMSTSMPKTPENLEKLALEVGLNVDQLKKDASNPETEKTIRKDSEIAGQLGIQGTPAFVINDQIVRGYIEYNVLKAIVEDKRSGKK